MFWIFGSRRRRADKLLAAGHVEKAIELYERDKAYDALVQAYQKLGNLPAAADAARKAALYLEAGRLYERAGLLPAAAEMWLQAEERDRAARAYERGGVIDKAVELYVGLNRHAQAADLLAGQNKPGDAAPLYEHAGDLDKAATAYLAAGMTADAARVLEAAGEYEEAARVWCEAGEKLSAAQLLRKAGRFAHSAGLFAEMGRFGDAGGALEEGGYPLEAAEQYEKDPATMGQAAELLCRCLQPADVWRREFASQMLCFDMTTPGDYLVLGCEDSYAYLLDEAGKTVWRYRPAVGTRTLCAAVSHQATCALACDDKRLYMLNKEGAVVWTAELQDEPTGVDMDASGDRIACSTKANAVLCFDAKGALIWRQPVRGAICDLAIAPSGKVVVAGTAEGECVFLDHAGETAAVFKADGWVDGVCLNDDGTKCALVLGMDSVALLDVTKRELLWTAREHEPVHSAILTADNGVLSVGEHDSILRDAKGMIVARHNLARRLLGGRISGGRNALLLWDSQRELKRLDLKDCRLRAAGDYERAGQHKEAAVIYEALGDHSRAADAYKLAGDLRGAARNIEVAGRNLEAAALYESLGDHEKAAPIFEAEREFSRAANCFSKIGQLGRAAQLYEQANEFVSAAELFERTGQHDKAGELFKSAGNFPSAIRALTTHVTEHPDALERCLDLGILLQTEGGHDKAIEYLQKATRKPEQARTALMHLAECFLSKNLYDIALSRYHACLKEGEKVAWENLDVYYGMAKTYHLAGNYAEARRAYEGILAVDYNYQDVRKRLADVQALAGAFGESSAPTTAATQKTVIVGVAENLYQRLSADTKERYVVKKELGRGGMGTVFLAEDTRLKRNVALKVLAPHLAADDSIRARMVHEAQAAAQIEHPNCVRVFDVGGEGDRCYITMEYVVGSTLRARLTEKGKLDAKECVGFLLQLTDGLGYAHGKGITHRDVKPENAVITSDGTVKVMDFGLALVQGATRLTMEGGACGTLPYMAPEQVAGKSDLTPAVDVYATGCMAYELLSGAPPFTGGDIGSQHMSVPPKPLMEAQPDVPPALAEIVMKCLAKDPAARYADAKALNAALRGVEKGN